MMYQHKMGEDLRCPLEYGLGIFGGSGSQGSYVFWRKEALYDTAQSEKK